MPAVSGSPTQLKTSEFTLANLSGLPDDGFLDGELAYVASVKRYFQMVRGSTAVVDGATILTTYSGNGRWIALLGLVSDDWATQATWFIDPVTGDDENTGLTALTALASWAEFRRRVSTLKVSMTVTILTAIAEGIIGDFYAAEEGLTLVVTGTPVVVVDAGATTTFTDPVLTLGACAQGTMTSAAVADFTPHIGRFLIATGGFIAPILGADGGGAPYLPFWARTSLSNTKPIDGTHVDVIDLLTATTINLSTHDGLLIEVHYFKFTSANFADAACIFSTGTPIGIRFVACHFAGFWVVKSDLFAIGCQLSGNASMYGYSRTSFVGGGSRRTISFASGDKVLFQGFLIQGGAGLAVGNASNATPPSSVGLSSGTLGLGVFGSSGDGVTLGAGAYINGGILYGSGNTGVGLSINYGAKMQVSTPSTITGTGGDLSFCGAGTAIPPLVGAAVVPAASALTTWAQLAAAPFGGDVMNYSNGTTISLT